MSDQKKPSPTFNWLDQISWTFLLIAAAWLAIAPYPMEPQPHLIQKLIMLSKGELVRPLDIFDLCMHSAPMVLIVIKLNRQKKQGAGDEA